MSSRIAVLKVTLDGVKPTVMRRLVVPLTILSIGLELGTGIGAQWGTTCAAGGGLSR
jgi:hypothetical protein